MMISLALKAENMHSYGNEIGFFPLLLFLFEKQKYELWVLKWETFQPTASGKSAS